MTKSKHQVISAFLEGREAKQDGRISTDGTALFVQNIKIVERRGKNLWVNNPDWSRGMNELLLNELPGVVIYRKFGVSYLNGDVWTGNWECVKVDFF